MPLYADVPSNLSDPLVMYNGEVTLLFDKDEWTYYLVTPTGLEPQSGVTGVCNIIDKTMYLMPWACKMMYLKILRTMPRIDDITASISWDEFDTILQEAKSAHKEKLDDAGDVGTAAHIWIEDTIRNAIAFNNGIVEKMNDFAPIDERSVNCGLAAFDWMKKHNVRWQSTERKIYSRKYKYAGTCDGTALVDSCDNPLCCPGMFWDQLSLIDWKSSNQLSVQYAYQTSAYSKALIEETGLNIQSRFINRLGKEDGKFESWYLGPNTLEQDFSGYLACLNLSLVHRQVTERMLKEKKLKTFHRKEEAKIQKERIKFENKSKLRES